MSRIIRPACPDDAAFIAWIMLTAGRSHVERGFWDQYVAGTEDECLTFLSAVALTRMPHPFHHSIFIIAEDDGRPVAGLSGYDPETLGIEKYLEALPEVFDRLRWSEAQQTAAFDRITSFLTCLPDDAPDVWIIESVAAIPEVRRQGITSLLLKDMIEQGRRLGLKRAQISLLTGNTPAQKTYEKAGFRIVDEKRHPSFEQTYGSPGISRLLLDLG